MPPRSSHKTAENIGSPVTMLARAIFEQPPPDLGVRAGLSLDVYSAFDAVIAHAQQRIQHKLRLGGNVHVQGVEELGARHRQREHIRRMRLNQPLDPLIHLRHSSPPIRRVGAMTRNVDAPSDSAVYSIRSAMREDKAYGIVSGSERPYSKPTTSSSIGRCGRRFGSRAK